MVVLKYEQCIQEVTMWLCEGVQLLLQNVWATYPVLQILPISPGNKINLHNKHKLACRVLRMIYRILSGKKIGGPDS